MGTVDGSSGMNEYLEIFLSGTIKTALIVGAVTLVLKLSLKEKPPDDPYHIKLPRVFFLVGIITTAISLSAVFGAFFTSESRSDSLFGIPFVALGLIILLNCVNWEIRIKEDEATYRNIFRRSFVFKAEEIESLRITKNVIRIKVKYKNYYKFLWVDPYAMNLESLAAFLRKNPELRKTVHQGRYILR